MSNGCLDGFKRYRIEEYRRFGESGSVGMEVMESSRPKHHTLFWIQSSGSGLKDSSTTFEVSRSTLLMLACLSVAFELKDCLMFDVFFFFFLPTPQIKQNKQNNFFGHLEFLGRSSKGRLIRTFPECGIVYKAISQSWLWTNISRRRQSKCCSKNLWVAIARL